LLEIVVWEMIFTPVTKFLTINFILFVQKISDIITTIITLETTATTIIRPETTTTTIATSETTTTTITTPEKTTTAYG